MLEKLFGKQEVKIDIVQATHDQPNKNKQENKLHQQLIAQYCSLRKGYKKHDPSYPDGLGIPGDMEAGFLLAVDNTGDGPKVVAGFRLNEVPAGQYVPSKGELEEEKLGVQADKIEPSRVENLFPGVDRAHYAILNVDGAMFDAHASRRVLLVAMQSLLEKMIELAQERGYDAVSLIPGTKDGLDSRIERYYAGHNFLKERNIPITDHGRVVRKGAEKRVLCVTLNPKLMELLSENAQRVAYR